MHAIDINAEVSKKIVFRIDGSSRDRNPVKMRVQPIYDYPPNESENERNPYSERL